jgi:hypothetical protein
MRIEESEVVKDVLIIYDIPEDLQLRGTVHSHRRSCNKS